jgi:hypothetical protein
MGEYGTSNQASSFVTSEQSGLVKRLQPGLLEQGLVGHAILSWSR